MEHILAIRMEYLQTLWLYCIALFAIHVAYLFVLGSLDIIGIGYILDYPLYIDIVSYLVYIRYRS